MRFDDRVQAYADKLLTQRQKKIEADHKKNIEAVFLGLSGSLVPHMMHDLVEAYVERIRRLGQARMESLITAHKDVEIPLDKDIIQEIKNQVISLCHNEQDDVYYRIPRLTPPVGATLVVDDNASRQIVDGVGSVMGDLSLDLDITSDKIGLAEETRKKIYGAATGKRWDAFISHASEDKEGFVRPLADALEKSGLEIWFDETTLKVGDRLREAIDYGLLKSRYGIVVLSKHFFLKDWTKEELEGLTTKEIGGVKVILPVWHNVTRDEVAKHSPTLAGRLAARSQDGLEKVVRQLREAMGKESPKPLESPKKNGVTLKKAPTSAPAPQPPLNQNVTAFQPTLPNVRCIGAGTISLQRDMYGGLAECDSRHNAMVIRFANEAKVGAQNLSARVEAVLIYKYGQNETDIAGSWLYEKKGLIDFEPDSRRHKLLIGMVDDGEFVTIASERVTAHGRIFDQSDKITLNDFHTGTVFVQLIDVRESSVLFEGEFALNTDPLSITRLSS